MKRAFTAAVIALALASCAAPSDRGRSALAFSALKKQLVDQYHECIPLGWAPVPVGASYYPGYTASIQSYHMWLDAIWAGIIRDSDLRDPQARQVQSVLDALVHEGLLTRTRAGTALHYYLKPGAVPYFFGSHSYGNNNDSLSYLCYSSIVPSRILWTDRAHIERYGPRRIPRLTFHATFEWTPTPPAAWAQNPVLQSHSIVLPPTTTPTTARFERFGDTWYVVNIYSRGLMLPALADKSAWLQQTAMNAR